MAYLHPSLTEEKWQMLSKTKQILNIGSELTRAKNSFAKGYGPDGRSSLDRALELLDLTIGDPKWQSGARRELLCLREHLGAGYNASASINWHLALRVLFQLDAQAAMVEV